MFSSQTTGKRNPSSATIYQREHSSTMLTTDTTVRRQLTSSVHDNHMLTQLTDLNNNNTVKAKYRNELKVSNKIKSTSYPGHDAFKQNKLPKIRRTARESPLSSYIASSSSKRHLSALECPSNNGTFFNEKSMSFYSKPIKQTNSNTNRFVIKKVSEKPVEVLTGKDKEKTHIEHDDIHLHLSQNSTSSRKAVLTDTINSSRIKTLSKLPEIERAPSRACTDPHIQTNQQRDTVQREINKALKDNIITPFYGQDKEQFVTTIRLKEIQKMALKEKDIAAKSAQIKNSLNLSMKQSMFEEPECCSAEIEEFRSKKPRGKYNDINRSNMGGKLHDRHHREPAHSPDSRKSQRGSIFYSGTQRKSISGKPSRVRSLKVPHIKYENTYRLDPVVGYVYKATVGKLIVDYVTSTILKDYKYSCTPVEQIHTTGSSSSLKCQDICHMVVRKISSFDFRRYRFVCHATLTSLKGQGVFIADRQLSSRPYDFIYSYTLDGGSLRKNRWVAVVSLWAIYMD